MTDTNLRDAAQAVLRIALDSVEVHPCDADNDKIRARHISREMQALREAITSQALTDDEITDLWADASDPESEEMSIFVFARLIEARLRTKEQAS